MSLPQKLPWDLAQTKWASDLAPVIQCPLVQGQALKSIVLSTGSNVINHKLQRMQQGWYITDQNAAASIYRSAAFNNLTLTLTSSAPVTINLWVF